ncbi:MAG: cation transporter [Candidatus Marinimicrobia bacterium]|jgi:divalent metal cation (Fe/Co/Zn/Cd) transporter|nr:cation transporter [Candidatus Neomarinimicrobiota bacterium]MBT3501273.1 cation transporter [Candidatus Neomarinimicrobiota bacterium]MBT3839177.1 cation transporter [Candidatus Neomarinimicrobiota bacterium]MBT3999050.1 cation transporter [Candidatus Neomarinimicrobiota bacterium]MBT4283106.1 cation transporter [Candidatus Neomarinimicrobiota bacterium]
MKTKESHLKFAIILSIVTVVYNIFEGIAAIYFGIEDETLALFGFGLDSFVEVISGIGIWHMVLRIQMNGNEQQDKFEKRALKITGFAFYLLTAGLVVSSSYNLWIDAQPETTLWGVIISGLSLGVMWWLVREKRIVGNTLNSDAILADANCTRACMQLSAVLLISSLGYELFNIGRIDAIGSFIIAGLAFREGRESFEKAKNQGSCCGCDG